MHRDRIERARAARFFLATFVGLAAAFAVGCTTPSPPPPMVMAAQVYRVGSPDRLAITVLPEPPIEREVVVRPDGMISVDLIGDVPASGRSVADIAADIEKRIGRYKRDARVTVALVASLHNQITVLGEVSSPSTFALSRPVRVVEAIGHVGGAKVFGAKGSVRLIRTVEGQPKTYAVNLGAIERGDLRTNFELEGGDIIYVPPTPMVAVGYVVGQVLFPFTQLFGFGARVTTTVMSGGVL